MRRRRFRLILLIAISASLGGVAYKVTETIWRMKARELKNPVKILNSLPEAALHIKDFHRANIEGDRKVWEIFGDEAHYLKADQQLVIQKPRILFYQKDNTTIEAVGNEGRVWLADDNQGMEKAKLEGDVVVNYKEYVLKTNEVIYLKSKNQVSLPGKVSMKGNGMELDGADMEINLDAETMQLHRNVRAKILPERLEKMKGRSDEKKSS